MTAKELLQKAIQTYNRKNEPALPIRLEGFVNETEYNLRLDIPRKIVFKETGKNNHRNNDEPYERLLVNLLQFTFDEAQKLKHLNPEF